MQLLYAKLCNLKQIHKILHYEIIKRIETTIKIPPKAKLKEKTRKKVFNFDYN